MHQGKFKKAVIDGVLTLREAVALQKFFNNQPKVSKCQILRGDDSIKPKILFKDERDIPATVGIVCSLMALVSFMTGHFDVIFLFIGAATT